MSRLPTTTTALAALTPTAQDFHQVESQVSAGGLTNMLTDAETAIGSVTPAASALGATTTNLTTQRTYVSNLSSSLTTGVDSLVDANIMKPPPRLPASKSSSRWANRPQHLELDHFGEPEAVRTLEFDHRKMGCVLFRERGFFAMWRVAQLVIPYSP
jgi:hypothetical protein